MEIVIVLDEYAAREYMRGRFPCLARAVLATDVEEAIRAAERIGWPVVLKASIRGIGHKSDFSGVELDLKNPEELGAAYARLVRAAESAGFGEVFRGVLVEERLRGVEFILGALRDPSFGPVVMVGSGGVMAELLRDTTFRLAPLDAGEAERAIRETRASRLLSGYRGSPPLPIGPLVRALVVLGDVIAGDEDLLELDMNPFILGPAGGAAADVFARLRPS